MTDWMQDYRIDVPELANNWDGVIRELHQSGCPVARSEDGTGYWVVNSDAEVRRCARDWETFSSSGGYMPNRPDGMPYWYPLESDPPLHDKLRSALNPHLSPRAIASKEDAIRRHANGLIDLFIADGRTDIVSSYSSPLPGLVFFDIVAGMPLTDMPMLQSVLHKGLLGPHQGRTAAFMQVLDYMSSYLEMRQKGPRRGDLIDAILEVEIEGYRWADRCGTLSQLTLGGVGTSGHVIASVIHHLAGEPELRDRLRQAGTIDQRAIEEFLRIFASSPHDGRTVTADVDVAGTKLSRGDYILLGYGAACRDPKVFQDPDKLDIDRFPNPHVAFGTGLHRCVGSHVARMQIRVAVEVFLERIPEWSLESGFIPTFETGAARSMMSLPIEFAPGDRRDVLAAASADNTD